MLNELGFYRPTYEDILNEKIQKAKDLFGDDIETSEQTPLGKFIRIGAYDLAQAYEDIEAVYYARFPNTATGQSLDRLCVFAGITRNPATFASHKVNVHGEPGTEVEEIIVCGNDSDITFHNITPFTIPDDGYMEIIVECEVAGEVGNVATINAIVNPIADITGVSYVGIDEIGADLENDVALRERFATAIEGAGSGNVNAIKAAILRVPSVKSVSIIENAENETVDGRPPHSFECYVYGGDDELTEQRIAEVIFDKTPIGIRTCSTSADPVEIPITDTSGGAHVVRFSHTENIPVYINVEILTSNKFEEDGRDKITTALAAYINSLGVGETVIWSALYSVIYGVTGVADVSLLEIGTSPDAMGTGNISTKSWQVAQTDGAKIALTESGV